MAKYIDAVKSADIISERLNIPLGDLVDIFADIPTADVVEVKHGEWIKTEDDGEWKCSECGGEIVADAYGDVHPLDDCGWIGCPYCLAKMDGRSDA